MCIRDSSKAYLQGRTPNPCILCNPSTKFRFLLETADQLGIRWVATGHYAGLERSEGRTLLKKAELLLFGELATALDIEMDQVQAYISEKLNP